MRRWWHRDLGWRRAILRSEVAVDAEGGRREESEGARCAEYIASERSRKEG